MSPKQMDSRWGHSIEIGDTYEGDGEEIEGIPGPAKEADEEEEPLLFVQKA